MLISYLSTWNIVLPFKNIPEFLSKTNYKVATSPGSSYMDAFKLSNDSDWKLIWNERMKLFIEDYRNYVPENDWMSILKDISDMALYYDYNAIK